MPYIATRQSKIAGRAYQRGDIVDTSPLAMAKLGSLVRVGLLVQKDDPSVAEALTPTMCELCGEGPFKRLDMHMRVHENPAEEDEEGEPESEEEDEPEPDPVTEPSNDTQGVQA